MTLHLGLVEIKVVDYLKSTGWTRTSDIAYRLNYKREHVYNALQRLHKRKFVYKKKSGSNCIWHLNNNEIQKKLKIVNKPQTEVLKSNKTFNLKLLNTKAPDFYLSVGKKMLPIISSFSGVPTSRHIVEAVITSIDDSSSYYSKSNEFDGALYIGIRSFIKTYSKNYSIGYLQKNIQNDNKDDGFNEVLEGVILLSSILIENV